jgi:hypothetical protein
MMNIGKRIGLFFTIIGLILMMFLVASVLIGEPQLWTLPSGMLITILGLVLVLRRRTPPTPSGRFRTIRTVQQKLAERGSRRSEQSEKR